MAEAFPISGNIDPVTFPFLLADLHRQGATGSLKVEGPSYPKALYFRGGRVLFGSSNDPKDQLGAILIESGKITAEQLDEVNTKVGPGNPLAKVLAESGFVNQRELSEAARVKVERILSDVISYTAGAFEFEDGVLPKGAVDLKLSTEKLVLAAVARLTDRGFVLRHLESLGVVLTPTPGMGERMGELRPEAGDLPERIDGQRSLKEAASLTRLDEFEAAKVACALLFLGLVEKAAPPQAQVEEEVDLAQTARMAFDDAPAPVAAPAPVPVPAPAEPAFFVPEAEAEDEEVLDVTIPGTPPVVGEPETPPLGVNLPPSASGSAITSPGSNGGFSLAQPEPEPRFEPAPEPPPPPLVFPTPSASGSRPRIPTPPPTDAFDRPMSVPSPPPEAPASPNLAFEEDPPHVPTPPARPSKEDLAALDALLNPSASLRTASVPASRPRGEKWEPQFRAGSTASGVTRPNRRRSSVPVVPVAVGGVVLLAALAGGWYYFGRTPKPPARPVARASPSPAPTLRIIEATPAPSPLPPSPGAAAVETAPATTLPAPPSTVAKAPPAPPPTTAPAPAAGGSDLAAARQLLQRRDYDGAARGFAASLRSPGSARFSVQLLVACSGETVDKALANAGGPELFILPVTYRGKSCYRLCWGLFETEARAEAAAGGVPAYFREGGARPRVSPTAGLLP